MFDPTDLHRTSVHLWLNRQLTANFFVRLTVSAVEAPKVVQISITER